MHTPLGLRALLAQIVDYAGLFPPASLTLDRAIRNYAAYLPGPEAWMLSRFVCPAQRLPELAGFVPLFGEGQPLAVSALGQKTSSTEAWQRAMGEPLDQIAQFRARHGASVSADMLEIVLPSALVAAGPAALREALDTAARHIEAAGPPAVRPFYEIVLGGDWRSAAAATLDALAAHNRGRPGPAAGFKLRTGGVMAGAFPTPEQAAFVLLACRDREVALKCTAGLHHPLRRFDPSVETKMFGFVNVFGAGVLGHVHGLSAAEVQSILEDEAPAHFHFDDRGFAWQSLHAGVADITRVRQTALLSFGSCSFDEPRGDLRDLGWM